MIAVNKPAGILVQPDKPGGKSLISEVKKYLKEKYNKSGNVFLGLVHRLDRNVSGIVLFAKTSKGASRLSEQFRNREVSKIYHALVYGDLGKNKGKLIHYLKKDEVKRKAFVSVSAEKDYDKAELEYEVLRSNKKYSLVKIKLITGRFHQIRAQFSHLGYPIVGDNKYLPAGRQTAKGQVEHFEDGSIALCSTEIEFKTATGDELKTLKIEYPSSWNKLLLG